MKWKGSLFFRFITALVDDIAEIRNFGIIYVISSYTVSSIALFFVEEAKFVCFDLELIMLHRLLSGPK